MRTAFEVAVIASGSKGNATLIKAGKTAVLVDAGVSCRKITAGLKACQVAPEELSGVLITHEHTDHVGGLPVLSRKYQLPIFANEGTWGAMLKRSEIERSCCRILPSAFRLGDLEITPFAISHDAANPVGYMFRYGNEKCTYLTDSGFVNAEITRAITDAAVLILEANHDEEMLKNGSYPQMLKERILGTRGHLSNVAAGWLLAKMPRLPQEVFLAHISQENNTPALALATVKNILRSAACGEELKIYVTAQDYVVHNLSKE
ncbi:MAG: MBL fold metallo-hydrolase [Acidaminococcaceae bacterium]